jgi:MFS family permease
MPIEKPKIILILIVISQFCGTSLWFAGNAVLPNLQTLHQWSATAVGHLSSAIQLGFITGTLLYAINGISDKHSPSKVFFVSSLLAAACNLISIIDLSSFTLMLSSRFLTGFFLAGIYPVGMKIAADWNEGKLGYWLSVLVAALVLGTSFPYALNAFLNMIDTRALLFILSIVAIIGGSLVLIMIKDGPYRIPGNNFSFTALIDAFKIKSFKAPALGYFGHMWELYAFWAFIPWILFTYAEINQVHINSSLYAFLIIASGALGCIAGGFLSLRTDSKTVANIALLSSGLCCLLSVFMWSVSPVWFIGFLLFWGVMVVADSSQFSALVAQYAPANIRGSAITMTTCIGFAITIFSIQLLNFAKDVVSYQYILALLALGPLFGLLAFNKKIIT